MDLTKCDLWQEDLSRLSVLMRTSTQERQSSRLREIFSSVLHSTEFPWLFEYCRSAFHQSPMPSESGPVYVEPVRDAEVDSSKQKERHESFSRSPDFATGLVYSQLQ